MIAVELVSYTLWFQVRMHYQLPYIRECLATGAHEEEAAVQQATKAARLESGWRLVVSRGLAWGALTTGVVAATTGLHVPWYVALPIACIGGLICSAFMLWVRKRLT